jgi:hypothetical protein
VRAIVLCAEESTEVDPDDTPIEEVKASLRKALQEARSGQRIPIAQMWESIDIVQTSSDRSYLFICKSFDDRDIPIEWIHPKTENMMSILFKLFKLASGLTSTMISASLFALRLSSVNRSR